MSLEFGDKPLNMSKLEYEIHTTKFCLKILEKKLHHISSDEILSNFFSLLFFV